MEIDWQIDQAAEYVRTLTIGDQLRPGLGAVSQITTRLKRPLHQLVRYYVDLLAQRQSTLEGHVVGALRGLAARSSANEDELKKLRAEVEQLRARVAELEPQVPTSDEAVLR
jgi:transposase